MLSSHSFSIVHWLCSLSLTLSLTLCLSLYVCVYSLHDLFLTSDERNRSLIVFTYWTLQRIIVLFPLQNRISKFTRFKMTKIQWEKKTVSKLLSIFVVRSLSSGISDANLQYRSIPYENNGRNWLITISATIWMKRFLQLDASIYLCLYVCVWVCERNPTTDGTIRNKTSDKSANKICKLRRNQNRI